MSLVFWLSAQASGAQIAKTSVRATHFIEATSGDSRRQVDGVAVVQARHLLSEADAILWKLPDSDSTFLLRGKLFDGQIAARDFDNALSTVRKARQDAGSTLVSAELAAGQLPLAMRAIKELGLDGEDLLKVITYQISAGDLEGAFETYQTMSSRDDFTRAIALSQLAVAHDARHETATSAEMRQAAEKICEGIVRQLPVEENGGVGSSDHTILVIAMRQAGGGDVEGALQSYHLLHADSYRSLLSSIIAGTYAQSNKDSEALKIAEKQRPGADRGRAFEMIALGQAVRGDSSAALKTYGEAKREIGDSDEDTLPRAAKEIAEALAKANDYANAASIAASLQAEEQADVLLSVAEIQAAKDISGAVKTAEIATVAAHSVGDASARARTYVAAASTFDKLGDITRERAALQAAYEAVKAGTADPQNYAVRILERYLGMGDAESALKIAEGQEAAADRAYSLALVAAFFEKNHRTDSAREKLAIALDILRKGSEANETFNVEGGPTLVLAVEIYTRLGDEATAQKLLDSSALHHWDMCRAMSRTQAELGRFEAAYSTAQRLPEGDVFRDSAVAKLTTEMARAKGVDLTSAWVHNLRSTQDRANGLISIAAWLLKAQSILK